MKDSTPIAQVILDHYHERLDHLFDYKIPANLTDTIQPGMCVLVPFGKSNRMLEAFVMNIRQDEEVDPSIKPIHRVIESIPVLTPEQRQIISWFKQTYFCRAIEAIRCFVPPQRVGKRTRQIAELTLSSEEVDAVVNKLKRAPVQQKIIHCLQHYQTMLISDLIDKTGANRSSIKALIDKKMIAVIEERQLRNPFEGQEIKDFPEPILSEQQKEVIEMLFRHWSKKPDVPALLHGITGSGKTEIYLRLIRENLAKNQDSIMLVPEIALTPQMVQRFRGRFGDQVAVLHSHLSQGEKMDEWERIRSGQAKIVIGPRSAVFAPCQNLGIIIVDEEHENTYKSEQSPRYHAVEVAKIRGKIENARLLFGSATPSIETYYEAVSNQLMLVQLKERISGSWLPTVEVVDMRHEIRSGNGSLISGHLLDALSNCLEQGEQAILLLNRRAFSTHITCLQCGFVFQCDQCDITMKWHKADKALKCHYCGRQHKVPTACPECGESLAYQGAGTQKAEDVLHGLFPDRSIQRMDQDATRQKGAHQKILNDFDAGKIDILVGTQMIAKGLDFPNVTLVGILLADTSLNLPDFRAAEKTFQLITQVAGRAGRGASRGKVVLQTYQPDHYALRSASRQDYESFYKEEIQLRREFSYPPYSRIIQLIFSGTEEDKVKMAALRTAESMHYLMKQYGYTATEKSILQPVPALISRIENRYRYTMMLKNEGVPFSLLKKMIKYLLIEKKAKIVNEAVSLVIDPDPRFVV